MTADPAPDPIPAMGDYFRFRVQLVGVKPAIYRRFLLASTASFYDLHQAIQTACAWKSRYEYAFVDDNDDVIAIEPDADDACFHPLDSADVMVADWFSLKGSRKCIYEYDDEDVWKHTVTLETIEKHDGKWSRRLIDGERAFPVEDCGGVAGYRQCLKVLESGNDPHDLSDLIAEWQPEHFDLVGTKKRFDK